jgi:hypothetical protein
MVALLDAVFAYAFGTGFTGAWLSSGALAARDGGVELSGRFTPKLICARANGWFGAVSDSGLRPR